MSPLETPFGRIDIETLRESPDGFALNSFRTRGRLLAADGEVLGVCFFTTHARQPGSAPLGVAAILLELEAISAEDGALGEALVAWRRGALETYINASCLLVSERIEVFAPARGSGVWKHLYFATLAAALAPCPARPAAFFFKVFPLEYAGLVSAHNRGRFEAAVRRLKLFYAAHVNARSLELPGGRACYMHAPVPPVERVPVLPAQTLA